MTPAERTTPKIINGSRRARIAAGSGVTVMDVNQLLNRFAESQKMMKQMGGLMGLPGAGRRKGTKSPKNKRKGKKGGGGGASRARIARGLAGMGGLPGGMPQLPPGLDPSALAGPDGDFTPPKLDFGKKDKPDKPDKSS